MSLFVLRFRKREFIHVLIMKAVLPDFIHVERLKNEVQYLAVRINQSSHPHTTSMYNSVAGCIKALWLAPSFFGAFLAPKWTYAWKLGWRCVTFPYPETDM